MDIKMPVMSGLEAVERIMEETPTPIIVVSTADVKVVVRALTVGAMDFVSVSQDIEDIAKDLVSKIKVASKVRPFRRIKLKSPGTAPAHLSARKDFKVIAIGVSTGGPQALQALLSGIPKDIPAGILVVQHMSKGFIDGLVEWLKYSSPFDIKVARAGDTLECSQALFAPDGYHMTIGADGRICLSEDTSRTSLHVPSIDVMMGSVARSFGNKAVGVIMTGMGKDGVSGIRAIRAAGGKTIAQDEKTSVIYGMNRLAVESGIVDHTVSLEEISSVILRLL
jgi:two-component system chemotaxis response regulator CheB